jgi:hypothetical protein
MPRAGGSVRADRPETSLLARPFGSFYGQCVNTILNSDGAFSRG